MIQIVSMRKLVSQSRSEWRMNQGEEEEDSKSVNEWITNELESEKSRDFVNEWIKNESERERKVVSHWMGE